VAGGAALLKTVALYRLAGRAEKHGLDVLEVLQDELRSLELDFQDDVLAGSQRRIHLGLGYAVVLASPAHDVLKQLALLDHLQEAFLADEAVVEIMLLARPLGAGGG